MPRRQSSRISGAIPASIHAATPESACTSQISVWPVPPSSRRGGFLLAAASLATRSSQSAGPSTPSERATALVLPQLPQLPRSPPASHPFVAISRICGTCLAIGGEPPRPLKSYDQHPLDRRDGPRRAGLRLAF